MRGNRPSGGWLTGRPRPKGDALIALAVVALTLIGQSEAAAAVDGVQTFEWQGRP
jgi:hypothetical protein